MLTGINSRITGVLSKSFTRPILQYPFAMLMLSGPSFVHCRLNAGYQFPLIDDPITQEEGYDNPRSCSWGLYDCSTQLPADVIMRPLGLVRRSICICGDV
jgi:hypothetical protein